MSASSKQFLMMVAAGVTAAILADVVRRKLAAPYR